MGSDITKATRVKGEFEFQTSNRSVVYTQNYIGAVIWRLKSKIFVNLLAEWSNDRFVTNTSKTWLGSTVRYKLNYSNQFQLFVGERRGGPACSAGICYEVLDFKGVEMRWMARF